MYRCSHLCTRPLELLLHCAGLLQHGIRFCQRLPQHVNLLVPLRDRRLQGLAVHRLELLLHGSQGGVGLRQLGLEAGHRLLRRRGMRSRLLHRSLCGMCSWSLISYVSHTTDSRQSYTTYKPTCWVAAASFISRLLFSSASAFFLSAANRCSALALPAVAWIHTMVQRSKYKISRRSKYKTDIAFTSRHTASPPQAVQ